MNMLLVGAFFLISVSNTLNADSNPYPASIQPDSETAIFINLLQADQQVINNAQKAYNSAINDDAKATTIKQYNDAVNKLTSDEKNKIINDQTAQQNVKNDLNDLSKSAQVLTESSVKQDLTNAINDQQALASAIIAVNEDAYGTTQLTTDLAALNKAMTQAQITTSNIEADVQSAEIPVLAASDINPNDITKYCNNLVNYGNILEVLAIDQISAKSIPEYKPILTTPTKDNSLSAAAIGGITTGVVLGVPTLAIAGYGGYKKIKQAKATQKWVKAAISAVNSYKKYRKKSTAYDNLQRQKTYQSLSASKQKKLQEKIDAFNQKLNNFTAKLTPASTYIIFQEVVGNSLSNSIDALARIALNQPPYDDTIVTIDAAEGKVESVTCVDAYAKYRTITKSKKIPVAKPSNVAIKQRAAPLPATVTAQTQQQAALPARQTASVQTRTIRRR